MLKKDITFIYMDAAEKSMYTPIAQEAERRGYSVKFTTNKLEKCEIGFYCQHNNFPQFSKFSLILLHDIIQQYGNWPDIWLREPWNKYDIGILPSDQWQKNWDACSQWYYTRPRIGMYKLGWPKADVVSKLQASAYREDFYKKYGMDLEKKTILYAPSWENDGKQDDFVQAMLKLDVNIVIKQATYDPDVYPDRVRDIQQMYELHKDLERVTILPAETNIFEAIAVSDVLVSEESSTMCEATMMGIPAVSVSDWLVPDTVPSRMPKCDYDFVWMTRKAELSEFIRKILENYEEYRAQAAEYSRKNFANIGKTSGMIMDIIDDCVAGNPIRYEALTPQPKQPVPLKRNIKGRAMAAVTEIYGNYRVRYPAVQAMWNGLKWVKHKLVRK